MVKNCSSKAVLFCVPAQVTTHTHYLLMQLTCTCLAWHGPYHLCFQFLFSAVRSKSGRIGQGVGTESTSEFGKCCTCLSGLPVPYSSWNFSYLTENYTEILFWQYHPFSPMGRTWAFHQQKGEQKYSSPCSPHRHEHHNEILKRHLHRLCKEEPCH